MFDKIKRRIRGIEFYRIYYKPLGEQTGWFKYSDAYDGMSTPVPQDRFFDIEDPPKNRIYLCVGIKKDGKWAMDIPGTWKKKHGEDESVGESKAELKKRLEKLEKGAGESKIPSTEEIAGIIILNHINKKIESGDETIWSVVGQMLNPQSNNSNDSYNPFAETKLEIDGKMPWYMHPAVANTYMQGLPKFAEELSSSFIKGAKKEMAKGEPLQRQQLQQQPQELGYAEEGSEPADAIAEEEPLDIEVQPKSNTIARILAERAAEKRTAEGTTATEKETEEEISSEAKAVAERFDARDEDEEVTVVPKQNIKDLIKEEEEIDVQREEAKKTTLIERAREKIVAKKKIEVGEVATKSNIKERFEPQTEEILDVGTEGKGREEEERETAEEKAKKEAMRERMKKAREVRAANIKAKKEAEGREVEVEA